MRSEHGSQKFPAMAVVGMNGRLAGPAREEKFQFRFQLRSQLRSQLPFLLCTRFFASLNAICERFKEANRRHDEDDVISKL